MLACPYTLEEAQWLEWKAGWTKIKDDCPEEMKKKLKKKIVEVGSRYTEPDDDYDLEYEFDEEE